MTSTLVWAVLSHALTLKVLAILDAPAEGRTHDLLISPKVVSVWSVFANNYPDFGIPPSVNLGGNLGPVSLKQTQTIRGENPDHASWGFNTPSYKYK